MVIFRFNGAMTRTGWMAEDGMEGMSVSRRSSRDLFFWLRKASTGGHAGAELW